MTHDTVSYALSYIERGWAVVVLHDVTAGTCSCGSAEAEHVAKQGGKHPVHNAWQTPQNVITTQTRVRNEWAARPGANIGIATGVASGFWVLDVDPDNGGNDKLSALIAAYGMLPDTYTVTTGSGGTHYYFRLPDFVVGGSRGRLPVGLDVRGNGGQVVAPPSVSGKGSYSVLRDTGVAWAPAWLLDLIRPKEAPAPTGASPLGIGAGGAQVSPAVLADRGPAYAAAAAERLLGELATALVGTRNDVAFRVACRLGELVNAPWSGLDGADIAARYMAAAEYANRDGSFSPAEAWATLTKGARHVAGRVADLPTADFLGSTTDWARPPDAVPFAPGAVTAPEPGSMFSSPSMGPAPAGDPGGAGGYVAPSGLVVPDWYEQSVAREVARLDITDEARRRRRLRDAPPVSFIAELLDDEGLDSIPQPAPLVDGWLWADSFARLIGAPGEGKSFILIDLACCVSTGTPWHGRDVTQGRVVYVIAEGASGLGARRRAWCQRHQLERSGVMFVPRPVQITGGEWPAFIRDMAELAPSLIIIDTQARATVGVNENDATEMGSVVAALGDLRAATAACVLLAHHTNERGGGRGSTAVFGALDTELSARRVGTTVTLRNPKQKDAPEQPELMMTLTPYGPAAVLIAAGDVEVGGEDDVFRSPRYQPSTLELACRALASVMVENWGEGQGGTRAEIALALFGHPVMVDRPTAYRRTLMHRAWSRFEALGRIAVNPVARSRFRFVEILGADIFERNQDNTTEYGWPVMEPSNQETTDE